MKTFIALSLLLMSGAAYAGNAEFLPQCTIKSASPYFQPDTSKYFYLARNSENQTTEYCNEESLLKDKDWVNYRGRTLTPETKKIIQFAFTQDKKGKVHTGIFSICDVKASNHTWDIGDCVETSDVLGHAILNDNS